MSSLVPADKGWLLAVVIIIIVLNVQQYLSSRNIGESLQSLILKQYQLTSDEHQAVYTAYAENSRRSQETIRELAEALTRQSDRSSRAAAQAVTTKESTQ